MKNNTIIAIFFLFTFLQIQAQSPQEVIGSFFEALNSKNHERLKELCLEDMQLHSLAIGQERKVNSQTRQGFIDGIKSIPKETIIFEDILSQKSIITEYLAQYSLPYSFYVNDKLSHKGTNVITLLKTTDGWKISYIADTREKS